MKVILDVISLSSPHIQPKLLSCFHQYSYVKEDDYYSIAGYVDADNAFGANLRESWGVMVEYDGKKTDLIMVRIGDETFFD